MWLGISLILLALAGSVLLTVGAVQIVGPVAWWIAGGLLCFVFIFVVLGRVGMREILTEGLRRIWLAED